MKARSEQGEEKFETGTDINTGYMIAGNFGSENRMDVNIKNKVIVRS